MKLSNKQWNQGNLALNPFAMQRQRAVHQVQLNAPVAQLFERACLSGQPGWLPVEGIRLTDSDTGCDVKNVLWSESETGETLFQSPGLQTFWTTTELDREQHRYQAVLINPELAIGTLDVEMEQSNNGTIVHFDLSYTVLSEAGSALFDEGFAGRLVQMVERFGHTLTTGLATEPVQPVALAPNHVQSEVVEHEITITGDIDECFALACPVAELLWIDDWKFDLVYSESGKNETGCVFLEFSSGLSMLRSPSAHTYWYTTLYDAEQYHFDAIWVTRDLLIARWEVTMAELGGGQVQVNWKLRYSSLGAEGSCIIGESGLAMRMKRGLSFIATSLRHYVETGSIFRLSGKVKMRLAASLIGATLGRHFRQRVLARTSQQLS